MRGLGARLRSTVGDPSTPVELQDDVEAHAFPETPAGSPHRSVCEAMGGAEVQTPHGAVWVIEHRHAMDELHGSRRLGDFYEHAALEHLPLLTADPRLRGELPESAIFLDIEATGLDHGAGTQAFMVGLGRLEGDELVVRQLIMREPGEERALLHLLWEYLESEPLLVSFNGKSYDLTVLQSRMVLQRFYTERQCNLKLHPHLDLLHLSRNLYRERWPDTRLGTLERQVLGFERVDDLPGHLAPAAWFHFLRTGEPGPLSRVATHNHHDVLSMVTLATRLIADSARHPLAGRHALVTANLGHLLLRRGDAAGAVAVLEGAVDADPAERDVWIVTRSLHTLAHAARRVGAIDLQHTALRRLVALDPLDAEGLRALAIASARGARDLSLAVDCARRAQCLAPTDVGARRVARLAARLARATTG